MSTITIKTTTEIEIDAGGVPAGLLAELIRQGNDGTSIGKDTEFSIFDLTNGSVTQKVDEVAFT